MKLLQKITFTIATLVNVAYSILRLDRVESDYFEVGSS